MMRYLFVAALCLGIGLVARGPFAREAPQTAAPQASAIERGYRANNTGVALLEQFNYQDAEKAFREALAIRADLAIARVNLAIAILYAGRPGDALVEAREGAARLPESPNAHYVLGLAARADDKLDDAAAAFARVLAIDPADAGAKINLGQIHLQQRRYPEALTLFQEAIAVEPHNVTAAYNAALALTRSGQAEEGRAAMQRFEALRDSAYGVTFAQTYLSQGRYGEAIASTGAEAGLVDRATPDVRFADVTAKQLPPLFKDPREVPRPALFDADNDGDLDLFVVQFSGARFLRNTGGSFADETAKVGIALQGAGGWTGAVAGDYDNDGRPDLVAFGAGRLRLLHQTAAGRFEDVTATAGFPAPMYDADAGAFADVDHDGDLDIVVGGNAVQLLRNNGNGTFTDIAAKAGIALADRVTAIAATDYDNRRDVDLIFMTPRGPVLFRNMRDGTFRDWSKEAGLERVEKSLGALAIGDINKDGYPDLVYGGTNAEGTRALSDGKGRFTVAAGVAGRGAAIGYQLFDYDNDGLLDLFSTNILHLALFRNPGQGAWLDVVESSGLRFFLSDADVSSAPGGVAVGDLDNDGDSDVLVTFEGRLHYLRNEGGNRNGSLSVRLTSRVSNRTAAGSKIEMRAGSLRQALERSSSSPAVAPADLVFGLGARTEVDVVRVQWPSGILQAETDLAAARVQGPKRVPLSITELDRKPSSCPYLFTWNGTRFEFITDFMGGGEMGAWLAPAVWNQPDPDEYVRIRSDQLQPRSGRYELRMTNELEEALFFDRVQLVAVDHAAGEEVHANEGLRSAPRPAFKLTRALSPRVPDRVIDEHGHDVRARVAALDRQYPDDFRVLPIRGYAEPHELVIDVGAAARPVLLLTGWTDYAFSNDNVAASQAGTAMAVPSLQVRDAGGRWKTVIDEIGFPVGRPQTVVVDLAGTFLSSSREVRIVTNMRIYWDRILVAEQPADGDAAMTMKRIEASSAELRWRGLSEEITPDGREPYSYAYERVSRVLPWKALIGRYTREGDVRELLGRTDDMFVISRPGDEVSLTFAALPPPAAGRERTFLLYVHGYSKEMNPRSAMPDAVEPLPFRAMSGYPYGSSEHYPRTQAHRDYRERYNTRIVARPQVSIDVAAIER